MCTTVRMFDEAHIGLRVGLEIRLSIGLWVCVIIIKIMENELIKERIESIWNVIKSSKGVELERHLETAREHAAQIIGSNEI